LRRSRAKLHVSSQSRIDTAEGRAGSVSLKKAQEEGRQAEAEARKLSDQQPGNGRRSRRAAMQARQKMSVCTSVCRSAAKSKQKPARARRKPLPIGKMLAGLFVLALIAVAGLPYVWPLAEYCPVGERISAQLNQPVKINTISLAFLPRPKLELHNLTVGSAQELRVGMRC